MATNSYRDQLEALVKAVEDWDDDDSDGGPDDLTMIEACVKARQFLDAHPPEWGEPTAIALLRRIRQANIIFPSMCANNTEAYNILGEIDEFLTRHPATGEKA